VSSLSEAGNLEYRAKNIVKERLLSIPEELKKYVPPILFQEDLAFYTKMTTNYFIFVCTSPQKRAIFETMEKAIGTPFPHLITTHKTKKHMFYVDRARNTAIGKMTLDVGPTHSFYIGRDSTLLLYDIRQKGIDKKLGDFQYDIDVAFIVSIGDEIRYDNLLVFFESLIAFAFKTWKSGYESK